MSSMLVALHFNYYLPRIAKKQKYRYHVIRQEPERTLLLDGPKKNNQLFPVF